MFYVDENKTVQVYFSNNSWSVFCPLGGVCCFCQLRSKAVQQSMFKTVVMTNVRRNAAYCYLLSIYFYSRETTVRNENSR